MLALGASYTTLLNTLMLEQYVTAYFWLMLAASCICTGRTQERLGFYGATGSLLTNVALARGSARTIHCVRRCAGWAIWSSWGCRSLW